MAINPSVFNLYNMTDTCAVWNVISSRILFSRADQSGVKFYCTQFIIYECLHKKRSKEKNFDIILKEKLICMMRSGQFAQYSLDVEDLQHIEILHRRKNLGKGELSAIAFAKKAKLAYLSDDQQSRKLALEILPSGYTQTTPHLFSWLIYNGLISDSEKFEVIEEHRENGGNIAVHLNNAYLEACRCRSVSRGV